MAGVAATEPVIDIEVGASGANVFINDVAASIYDTSIRKAGNDTVNIFSGGELMHGNVNATQISDGSGNQVGADADAVITWFKGALGGV